jgi:hypothetical protein
MQKSFQKLSTLSNFFQEARMPRMGGAAGPEAHQESPEQPRKMPPDVQLGKRKADDMLQSFKEDMDDAEHNEKAEKILKDPVKAKELVLYMLNMLTDKGVEERRSLKFSDTAKNLVKFAQDPQFHELLVKCAIARENGDDSDRREAAGNLVNALAQNGALEQSFVAQLEKAGATGKKGGAHKGNR